MKMTTTMMAFCIFVSFGASLSYSLSIQHCVFHCGTMTIVGNRLEYAHGKCRYSGLPVALTNNGWQHMKFFTTISLHSCSSPYILSYLFDVSVSFVFAASVILILLYLWLRISFCYNCTALQCSTHQQNFGNLFF